MMNKQESRLQYECFLWFSQEYPKRHGSLFAVRNEAKSDKDANYAKSMGVVPGVSDLLYIDNSHRIHGIEIKIEGSRHDVFHVKRQAEWMINNCKTGYFITSLEMFETIFGDGLIFPLSPNEVLQKCNEIIKSGKKSIKF